jgi:hypothetical protein
VGATYTWLDKESNVHVWTCVWASESMFGYTLRYPKHMFGEAFVMSTIHVWISMCLDFRKHVWIFVVGYTNTCLDKSLAR